MADETIGIDIVISAESANSVAEIKKSIQDLKDAAIAAGNAGNEALAQKYVNAAGAAADKLGDLNQAINTVKGSSEKIGAISNIAGNIAGGFAAAAGAANLFGASQEDVQQQLLKVQAATSVLAGVQQLSNVSEQAGLLKSIALREISIANTKLQTAAEEGGIVVRNAAAAAQLALNAATNAFPALIIIGAIVALVAALKNLGDSAEESAKKQIAANEKILASTQDRYDKEIGIMKALGRDTLQQEIDNQQALQKQILKNREQINSNDALAYEDKKAALDKLDEQYRASLDATDLLRAQALKKEYDDEKKANEDLSKLSEEQIKAEAESQERRNEQHQQYLDALAKHYEDVENIALAHIAALEQYEQDRLAQERADADAQLALDEESAEIGFNHFVADLARRKQVADNAFLEDQKRTEAKLALTQYSLQSITALGNIFIKDQAKLEKFMKDAALIQIGIDTAKAISSVVAAASATSITPVDLAIKIAAGVATVLANIAKAKQLLSSKGAGSVTLGGAATGTVGKPPAANLAATSAPPPTTIPRIPRSETPGRGGSQNANAPQIPTKEECNCPEVGTGSTNLDENGNPITPIVRAFVVESEMTNTQGRIKKIKENNTFG